ncbi:hypothetical protein CERSUDRAFT_78912 [Gelatoporia subvermispora B]|uniref:Hydrophobin n=1 Tax=Ceriporiopsis subvermispora (strain B) TaxID=914234 RepID=M2RQR9_CERS8|nr:hypothetical protein CERSUDRAFT_78912 [Gelatoporia subvermispora B]
MKFSFFAPLVALATLAAATPVPDGSESVSANCCQEVGTANSPVIAAALGLLGIVLNDVDTVVGIGCIPITIVGVGSTTACTDGTVVTCDETNVDGLLGIGCIPITI